MKRSLGFLILMYVCVGVAAAAGLPNLNTSKAKIAVKKNESKTVKYKLTFDSNTSLQAVTQEDGSRTQTIDYSLAPEISYADYSVSAGLQYSQDLLEPKNNEFGDLQFTLGKEGWKYEYFSLAPEASLILPVKAKTRDLTGLKYNLGGSLRFSLDTKRLGFESWKIGYSIAYNKSFTDYDTNAKGEPNLSYRIRQRFAVAYKFTDKWSFKTRFQFDSNYSADDEVKNAFSHYQSVDYSITEKIAIKAGHSNSASLFHKDTYESNLKFFDRTTSEYFMGISIGIL